MRRWTVWIVALWLALSPIASAQQVLVRTTAFSALREAARTYMHLADLGAGIVSPRQVTLPGAAPVGPLIVDAQHGVALSGSGPAIVATTFSDAATRSALSAISLNPLNAPPLSHVPPRPDWRLIPGCLGTDPVTKAPLFAVLNIRQEAGGAWFGRLETRDVKSSPAVSIETVRGAWSLPGGPVAAVTLPPGNNAAVLCRTTHGGGAVLRMLDLVNGKNLAPDKPLTVGENTGRGVDPTGLAFDPVSGLLYVLCGGFALDRPDGGPVSWLFAFSAPTFEPLGPPIALQGHAVNAATPLVPAGTSGCWVTTRMLGAAFGFVTRVRFDQTGGKIETAASFRDVWQSLVVAAADNGAVAVGIDARLELWPAGQTSGRTYSFESPIRALNWVPGGLLVAEGNRVSRVSPESSEPIRTVVFQSGAVMDMTPLPDSLHLTYTVDSSETLIPSLDLPAEVVLHAEAAGHELRALYLNTPHGTDYRWRIQYDAQKMPWLRAFPMAGLLPTSPVSYLGIDLARFGTTEKAVSGDLLVYLEGGAQRPEAKNNPAPVLIHVMPPRDTIRRILWIGGTPEETARWVRLRRFPALQRLADTLAGQPHSFSHEQGATPFLDSLDPYAVVVIDANAAVQGAVARAALADYVSRGGALLFLGENVEDALKPALTNWLSSLGIHIVVDAPVSDTWRPQSTHPLLRDIEQLEFAGGVGFKTDEPGYTLVSSGAGIGVFVAFDYGSGRIAALASTTPLTDAQQIQPDAREMSTRLFEWLAAAGADLQDVDGDGLPDAVEDKNGNGAIDPGETDRLRCDTDNDGLPDGMENHNHNGRVDPGETSPLNPDSDGDGIFDGADDTPAPSTDAPVIDGIRPSEGPAEGGTRVLVSGRNLSADAELWLGDSRALSVRALGDAALLAETSPCPTPQGATVDIRIKGHSPSTSAVLPGGYRYTPLTTVSLTLDAVATMASDYQQTVAVRPDPAGGLWVDISPGQQGPYRGEIAIVRWAARLQAAPMRPVRLMIDRARILAPNTTPLLVRTPELVVTPRTLAGPETVSYTAPR